MRKNSSGAIWGIIFIILGGIIAMRSFGFAMNLFFDGWWTLLIIIPSFIGLRNKGNRTSSIIGLCVGILLFMSARNWIGWGDFGKFAIAAIFIIIGISMLSKRNPRIEDFQKEEVPVRGNSSVRNYSAIFSGNTIRFDDEVFEGANLSAAFGGLTVDLRDAIFTHDVLIEATCALGGIDIAVPSNVKVVSKCTPILGGVDNKAVYSGDNGGPIVKLYLNATCILGGIDIK